MPFRIYPEIDAEMLKVMTEPYDAVVARLRLTPDDPRIGKLRQHDCSACKGWCAGRR